MDRTRCSRAGCIDRLVKGSPAPHVEPEIAIWEKALTQMTGTRRQDATVSRAGLAHAVLADAVTM